MQLGNSMQGWVDAAGQLNSMLDGLNCLMIPTTGVSVRYILRCVGGKKMKRRIVVMVVVSVLLAASAHAQTVDLTGAVISGTVQDVRAALDSGADVNAHQGDTGMTPLIAAAKYNQEVIALLLAAGADANAKDTQYDATALMWAAYTANIPEVITMLLRAGADIQARDNRGMTTLMWAATHNLNPEVMNRLLLSGADIKARDNGGATALTAAAKGNRPEVIMLLLNAGADAQSRDNIGNTALSYAKYNSSLAGTNALERLEQATK
jgi:uncharacterized protein